MLYLNAQPFNLHFGVQKYICPCVGFDCGVFFVQDMERLKIAYFQQIFTGDVRPHAKLLLQITGSTSNKIMVLHRSAHLVYLPHTLNYIELKIQPNNRNCMQREAKFIHKSRTIHPYKRGFNMYFHHRPPPPCGLTVGLRRGGGQNLTRFNHKKIFQVK